jgi:hypothetical protein
MRVISLKNGIVQSAKCKLENEKKIQIKKDSNMTNVSFKQYQLKVSLVMCSLKNLLSWVKIIEVEDSIDFKERLKLNL